MKRRPQSGPPSGFLGVILPAERKLPAILAARVSIADRHALVELRPLDQNVEAGLA